MVECTGAEGLVRPSRKCTLTARDAFDRRRRGFTGSTIFSRSKLKTARASLYDPVFKYGTFLLLREIPTPLRTSDVVEHSIDSRSANARSRRESRDGWIVTARDSEYDSMGGDVAYDFN